MDILIEEVSNVDRGVKRGIEYRDSEEMGRCCRVSMSLRGPAAGGSVIIIFGLPIRFKFPGKREAKVYQQCVERTKMYQLPKPDVIYFALASLEETLVQHCAGTCPF